MKKVIQQIGKSVVPSRRAVESKSGIADTAYKLVIKETAKFPEIVGVEFGGSFAKGTWLARDADIDVFVRFKRSVTDEEFERISREIGFAALKKYSPYVRYSEHPYVEASIKDTRINVVPFYDTSAGRWKSAADRTPHHTAYMKKTLTPQMQKETRILKQFLKANGIYGAQMAKQGFSGYVAEVLISHYGTFEDTIKEISQIKENHIVGDTTRRFDTPLVIIDPVDRNRNLAAAISDENIGRLVLLARAFKERPSPAFFRKRKARAAERHWANVMVVRFRYKDRSPDVIWGQIKRIGSLLATQLGLGGFDVLRRGSFTDERGSAYVFFLLKEPRIPEIYQKDGPELFREGSSREFISRNLRAAELMWVGKGGRVFSLERREFTRAKEFVENFVKKNLDKCVPRGLQSDFKRGFEVSVGRKNLGEPIKEAIDEMISTDGAILYFSKKV